MPSFWIVHTRNGAPAVFIQDAASLVYARLAAAKAGFDGTFVEGHELDAKTAKKIPKQMIGRVLLQKEAAALLKRMA